MDKTHCYIFVFLNIFIMMINILNIKPIYDLYFITNRLLIEK